MENNHMKVLGPLGLTVVKMSLGLKCHFTIHCMACLISLVGFGSLGISISQSQSDS